MYAPCNPKATDEEKKWYDQAKDLFDQYGHHLPQEDKRAWERLAGQMVLTPSTRTASSHRIGKQVLKRPTWAHVTLLKIMFGGWESLRFKAIGRKLRRQWPSSDLAKWEYQAPPFICERSNGTSTSEATSFSSAHGTATESQAVSELQHANGASTINQSMAQNTTSQLTRIPNETVLNTQGISLKTELTTITTPNSSDSASGGLTKPSHRSRGTQTQLGENICKNRRRHSSSRSRNCQVYVALTKEMKEIHDRQRKLKKMMRKQLLEK